MVDPKKSTKSIGRVSATESFHADSHIKWWPSTKEPSIHKEHIAIDMNNMVFKGAGTCTDKCRDSSPNSHWCSFSHSNDGNPAAEWSSKRLLVTNPFGHKCVSWHCQSFGTRGLRMQNCFRFYGTEQLRISPTVMPWHGMDRPTLAQPEGVQSAWNSESTNKMIALFWSDCFGLGKSHWKMQQKQQLLLLLEWMVAVHRSIARNLSTRLAC